jgi:hypothetical protein
MSGNGIARRWVEYRVAVARGRTGRAARGTATLRTSCSTLVEVRAQTSLKKRRPKSTPHAVESLTTENLSKVRLLDAANVETGVSREDTGSDRSVRQDC